MSCWKSPTFLLKRDSYSLSKEPYIPWHRVKRAQHILSEEPNIPYRNSSIFPVKRDLDILSKELYIPYLNSPIFTVKRAMNILSKELYIPHQKRLIFTAKRALHSLSKEPYISYLLDIANAGWCDLTHLCDIDDVPRSLRVNEWVTNPSAWHDSSVWHRRCARLCWSMW